jgi:hypothetical protein
MNNNDFEIDKWLIESSPVDNSQALAEGWNPIFDADRHLVHIKFGPFWKLYLRPERFVKRFYHRVYPLPVENWNTYQQLKLYDGFCTMDVSLEIRFQATLKYAHNNMDALPDLNAHIKTTYNELIINLLEQELFGLSDGRWIQKGVSDIENRVSIAIGEMLVMQNIQAQVFCLIKPTFAEFPDVQLAQKNVYLCVLKENFEANNAKREELFRQEQEIEKQRLAQKQKLLEQVKLDAELERQMQVQEALNKRLLLEEQIKLLHQNFELEKQLYAEKIKQEKALKEISLEADIQEKEKKDARLRAVEEKNQKALLAHQNKLKEMELEADIVHYEKHELKWREVKDRVYQQLEQAQRQKQSQTENSEN